MTAIALVLVLEGMVPFISPKKYREFVAQIAQLGDNQIRTTGLIVMILGVVILFLARS